MSTEEKALAREERISCQREQQRAGRATHGRKQPLSGSVLKGELFANLIEEYGDEDRWGQQTLCFLRIDSYKYWVMGEIINRAAPIPSAEVRRRGEQWLRRHGKKIGPYGN